MTDGQIDYLLSLKLLTEYCQIVTNQENMLRIPLSFSEIEAVLALIVQSSTFHEVYYLWRPNLLDEKDNFILELAVAGGAESIITFNKKDFKTMELKFDFLIETPKEFFKRKGLL